MAWGIHLRHRTRIHEIDILRKKIFWSIELSALGILLFFLFVLNVANFKRNESMDYKVLEEILENIILVQSTADDESHNSEGVSGYLIDQFSFFTPYKDDSEILEDTSYVVAELDANGNLQSILNENAEEISPEAMETMLAAIIKEGKEKGRYEQFKYLKEEGEENTSYIIFMNSTSLNENIIQLLKVSGMLLLLAIVLFGLLSWYLARTLVKPIKQILEFQKQFISDASHELKTPVTVMNANISVLEREIGENKWLEYIKEEGTRMAHLVNDLLKLSKTEYDSKWQQDNRVLLDISSVVEGAALPFESVAFEKNISFEIHITEYICGMGNKEDIYQVIAILLDNAIKYTVASEKVILTVQKNKDKKYSCLIQVKNTGVVLKQEELPRLFERFYKTDKSRYKRDNSYGLGLAIAKALVEKNKGQISVSLKEEENMTIFQVQI